MRKALMQNVLDMVSTLYQAHDEIRNNIEKKQYIIAQSLLNQCQEFAVAIGTAIEEVEEENFITVIHIEEYCESLYRIHEELYVNNEVNANEVFKILKQYLLTVEYSIQHDITVKKEIVFLPYKASMWDSLESVWKAADEDPECDAYVIPIPYYDKNPDGTLRNEHYEGDNFPANVPITHYNNYNFKNRHPDAIFIHNPYDQCNYVTTVHPFFYTDKLKEYTDKLVYIPYYISAETDPYNYDAMEDRAGYVLSNGVLNSDIVIVQSENTKKLFVNILEKYIPRVDRSHWENKILGLGSPKLDRVNNVQRDDSKLPDDWRKVIYTVSGKRKRTIFYNISVGPLLNNPNMLEKIKDTLNFFRSNEDACLWWRPHPLYESTLASMRPELLEEYKEIVSRYKEEGWGIFDDGVDLDWAISETDAYYGDNSSVVNLYKEAKKSVMIQNAQVHIKQNIDASNISIWPSAFYVENDDVWFVHGKMTILMRYSLSKKRTYIIAKIPNESTFIENAYQNIFKWKNKIFLVPCWAREIGIYSTLDNKFQKIPLRNIKKYDGRLLFCRVYAFKKDLYCIPYYYEAILKIDMESCKIQYIHLEEIWKQYSLNIPNLFIHDAAQIVDEIVAVIANTNKVLFFNLRTGRLQIHIDDEERQYTQIANIEDTLYLYDKKENLIIKYNKDFRKQESFISVPFENVVLNSLESKYIIVDSSIDARYLILDKDRNIVYQSLENKLLMKKNLDYTYYEGIKGKTITSSDKYYFITSENMLYFFENGTAKIQMPFMITDNELQKMKKLLDCQMEEVFENDLYNIKDWMKNTKKIICFSKNQKKNCGKNIINTIKKLL